MDKKADPRNNDEHQRTDVVDVITKFKYKFGDVQPKPGEGKFKRGVMDVVNIYEMPKEEQD
jgi:hypothetical protein